MTDQAPELLPEGDPQILAKLLRAIAGGTDAQASKHDIIFLTAAYWLDHWNTRPTPAERQTKSAPDFLPSHLHEERLPSSDAAGFGADTERPVPQVREALVQRIDRAASSYPDFAYHFTRAFCEYMADQILALAAARPSDAAVALAERIKILPAYTGKEIRSCVYRVDLGDKTATKEKSVILIGAEHRDLLIAALYAIPHEEAVRAQTIEECVQTINSLRQVWAGRFDEKADRIQAKCDVLHEAILAIAALQPSKE